MGIGRRIEPGRDQQPPTGSAQLQVEGQRAPTDSASTSGGGQQSSGTAAREALFVPEPPRYSFDDVILNEATGKRIMDALAYRDNSRLVFEEWGLGRTHKHARKVGINLYGEPGTGKTMVAHAIAHHLNRSIIVVNYADIESKYVGETSKNLTAAFETAQRTNAILFFDEADAILSKRVTNMSSSTDVSVNQTRSVMLMLLNDHQDIILFATNFISNFDPAFMRRILAHIPFELPDEQARLRLWTKLIPPELPHTLDIPDIARRYEGVSGSDISNAVLLAAFAAARKGERTVAAAHFEAAVQDIVRSKEANRKTTSPVAGNVTVTDRIVPESYVKQMLKE